MRKETQREGRICGSHEELQLGNRRKPRKVCCGETESHRGPGVGWAALGSTEDS